MPRPRGEDNNRWPIGARAASATTTVGRTGALNQTVTPRATNGTRQLSKIRKRRSFIFCLLTVYHGGAPADSARQRAADRLFGGVNRKAGLR